MCNFSPLGGFLGCRKHRFRRPDFNKLKNKQKTRLHNAVEEKLDFERFFEYHKKHYANF